MRNICITAYLFFNALLFINLNSIHAASPIAGASWDPYSSAALSGRHHHGNQHEDVYDRDLQLPQKSQITASKRNGLAAKLSLSAIGLIVSLIVMAGVFLVHLQGAFHNVTYYGLLYTAAVATYFLVDLMKPATVESTAHLITFALGVLATIPAPLLGANSIMMLTHWGIMLMIVGGQLIISTNLFRLARDYFRLIVNFFTRTTLSLMGRKPN